MNLPDDFPVLFVKGHSFSDPTEKLYHSVGHELFVSTVVQTKKSLYVRLIFTIPFSLPVIAWKKLGSMEATVSFVFFSLESCTENTHMEDRTSKFTI